MPFDWQAEPTSYPWRHNKNGAACVHQCEDGWRWKVWLRGRIATGVEATKQAAREAADAWIDQAADALKTIETR